MAQAACSAKATYPYGHAGHELAHVLEAGWYLPAAHGDSPVDEHVLPQEHDLHALHVPDAS
jgi:hypothetical protein